MVLVAGKPDAVRAAFRAEAERLSEVAASEDAAVFGRPSSCPPWTVGELLYHVRIAVGRLSEMLAEPGDGGVLVSATGYYRDDHRFSATTNTDRISLAQRGAASLVTAALVEDFEQAWRGAWALVLAVPPAQVVRTRHGDSMLATEFLRTRVLELAVHGLDLAAGMGRDPWMTGPAAQVVEELLLPAQTAAELRRDLGWDRITLIAKATGRRPLAAAESALVSDRGIGWLSFG